MDHQDFQKKINNMDQTALKNATAEASRILGADSRKVNEVLGNPDKLSKTLSRLTANDIALIQAALKNPDKISDLLKDKKNADRLHNIMEDS